MAQRAVRRSPEQAEIERLRARAERAEGELAKTKAALEVVRKAHALLELLSESADTTARSRLVAENLPGASRMTSSFGDVVIRSPALRTCKPASVTASRGSRLFAPGLVCRWLAE